MSEPKKEDLLALLRKGIALMETLATERENQLKSMIQEDSAAIEGDAARQAVLLEQFRGWQYQLRIALPEFPLSQLGAQLEGAERAEFQGILGQLQEAILSNRSSSLPLYRYLQTSLCFTRGLLESVRGDCPGYDRAGHLRSNDFDPKQVVIDL